MKSYVQDHFYVSFAQDAVKNKNMKPSGTAIESRYGKNT